MAVCLHCLLLAAVAVVFVAAIAMKTELQEAEAHRGYFVVAPPFI